jgi:hypothetical protein
MKTGKIIVVYILISTFSARGERERERERERKLCAGVNKSQ